MDSKCFILFIFYFFELLSISFSKYHFNRNLRGHIDLHGSNISADFSMLHVSMLLQVKHKQIINTFRYIGISLVAQDINTIQYLIKVQPMIYKHGSIITLTWVTM